MSSNRDKFIELAQKRVTKAIKTLRLVGNLANKTNYSYTEDDARKILVALEAEVKSVRKRFENSSINGEVAFKL